MFGLRGAGLLGASVAAAAGVAYLIWNSASSSSSFSSSSSVTEEEKNGTRPETKPGVETVPAEAPTASEAQPDQPAGTQVLVLGLDGSGKTSLLGCLATGSPEQDVHPTQGFNAVSVSRDGLRLEFLEIGGGEGLRPFWQKYMSKALLLVFVVDSSDPQRFPLATRLLHQLLAAHPRLPLMVLANKQDLPGASSITDLHDALSLAEAGERRLFLIGTYVKKGGAELSSGVEDARELIVQLVGEGR
ncbi:ADP-ribosylation factor-like protein 9 [Antennarius striatus]|uniref:ADP-ribosylation factor-like protein 9 n=1 Tax=Antennarius striatus TaxID=241820 RepID=UPI0035B48295